MEEPWYLLIFLVSHYHHIEICMYIYFCMLKQLFSMYMGTFVYGLDWTGLNWTGLDWTSVKMSVFDLWVHATSTYICQFLVCNLFTQVIPICMLFSSCLLFMNYCFICISHNYGMQRSDFSRFPLFYEVFIRIVYCRSQSYRFCVVSYFIFYYLFFLCFLCYFFDASIPIVHVLISRYLFSQDFRRIY